MRRIFAIVSDLVGEFDDYLEEVGHLGDSLEWKTTEYRRLETNCALLSNEDHIQVVVPILHLLAYFQ
jgi:hypothetical protein